MAGRSGGGENEHQARGPHVLVEEVLELADGVEIRHMQARRRGRMEERRFDNQPGSQQYDRKREQTRNLHAAWKTGEEASEIGRASCRERVGDKRVSAAEQTK